MNGTSRWDWRHWALGVSWEVAEGIAKALWKSCYKDYQDYGFMYSKRRYSGKLVYEWENRPFQAACRLSGWKPNI